MHGNMRIKRQLTDTFKLPEEILMDSPIVKINADNELVVENHKGIIEYTNSLLKINSSIGLIKIVGCLLYIKEIDQYSITITGKIYSLEYIK